MKTITSAVDSAQRALLLAPYIVIDHMPLHEIVKVELHREQQLRLRLLQPPRRLERDAEVRARRRHRRVFRHHLEHRREVGLR